MWITIHYCLILPSVIYTNFLTVIYSYLRGEWWVELGSVEGENINGRCFSDLIAKVKPVSKLAALIHCKSGMQQGRKNYKFPSTFQISISIPIIYGFPIPVSRSLQAWIIERFQTVTLQLRGLKHYSETTALYIQRRATEQGTVRDRKGKMAKNRWFLVHHYLFIQLAFS